MLVDMHLHECTWLPEKVDRLEEFVEQLKTRQVRPAVWNGSSYDVVDMF